MPAPDSPLDSIDYTSLAFPSDRITVVDLRRAHPERFDAEDGDRFARVGPTFRLNSILDLERLFALAAFEKALGKPGDPIRARGLDRDDCVEELTEFYRTYRVADGRHATEQLIRDIETQAAAQTGRRR